MPELKQAGTVVLAAASLILPLLLWRAVYPASDWAALPLAALAVVLYLAVFAIDAGLYRARLAVAVRATSPVSRYLSGRLKAGLSAFVFVVLAVPVLAWQALSASAAELVGLVALILAAGILSLWVTSGLRPHFHPPFARSSGVTIATAIAALVFFPILAWLNWQFAVHPGEYASAGLRQAVMAGIADLPERRGWIAEALSPFYAFDAAKLWLAVQFRSIRWLFSLDSAVVGFLVARSAAMLASFVQGDVVGGGE